MKHTLGFALVLAAAVGCPATQKLDCADQDPKITLGFDAGMTLPFENGGRIHVPVEVTACGAQQAEERGEVYARCRADHLDLGDAGAATAPLLLKPKYEADAGDTHTLWGEAVVYCPTGGDVTIGASALGSSNQVGITVVIPELRLEPGATRARHVDAGVETRLCFSTTASAGSILYQLFGATDSSGSASGTRPLAPSACDDAGVDGSHAELVVSSPEPSFQVKAELAGTATRIAETVASGAFEDLTLTLSFPGLRASDGGLAGAGSLLGALPEAGALLDFEVEAKRADAAVPFLPVTLQASTPLTITPSPLLTDPSGTARGTFSVPDVSALTVYAIGGFAQTWQTLTRAVVTPAPVAKIALSIESPKGRPVPSTLPPAGVVVPFFIRAAEDSAQGRPIAMLEINIESTSNVTRVPTKLITDAEGGAEGWFVAPSDGHVLLRFVGGNASVSWLLSRSDAGM